MLVSTRGRYALRVMLELAQHGRDCYTALSSIASEQGISGKYLESIISTLSKGGLVEGVRGKGGGYRLTRPPEDYSVGEILRLAEGSLAPVACLDCGSDPCARAGSCRTRPLWERLDALICGYLDQVTLADLLSAPGSDSSPCCVAVPVPAPRPRLLSGSRGRFFRPSGAEPDARTGPRVLCRGALRAPSFLP